MNLKAILPIPTHLAPLKGKNSLRKEGKECKFLETPKNTKENFKRIEYLC